MDIPIPTLTLTQAEMMSLLNPSTDFYKKLALDCSGQQIAVDLFVIAKCAFILTAVIVVMIFITLVKVVMIFLTLVIVVMNFITLVIVVMIFLTLVMFVMILILTVTLSPASTVTWRLSLAFLSFLAARFVHITWYR